MTKDELKAARTEEARHVAARPTAAVYREECPSCTLQVTEAELYVHDGECCHACATEHRVICGVCECEVWASECIEGTCEDCYPGLADELDAAIEALKDKDKARAALAALKAAGLL